MELFSPEFFSALFAIIVIDLVLAGDNAIVIALAARGLPRERQKQVIMGHRWRHCHTRGHDAGRGVAAQYSGADAGRRIIADLDCLQIDHV